MSKKVWMITGSSRGLGAEMARAVLDSGDALIATARREESLAFLGQHEDLLTAAMDVTDEETIEAAVSKAVDRFGRIDVLVNNAGYGVVGAIEECSASEVEKIFQTNVFGILNVVRRVLPTMRSQRSGRIINMSSTVGYSAALACGIYSSTKFAVEGISEALHAEVLPLGIHVTVVEPGGFRTEFLEQQSMVTAKSEIPAYNETVGMVRGLFKNPDSIPLPGDPLKLAQAVLKLAASNAPPLRLPLGTDSLQRLLDKNVSVAKETELWRHLAISTDL
jgi:NAD(P)-dependent dehydrogenase (short-subunit alcohol dehydrogenase family)